MAWCESTHKVKKQKSLHQNYNNVEDRISDNDILDTTQQLTCFQGTKETNQEHFAPSCSCTGVKWDKRLLIPHFESYDNDRAAQDAQL